MKMAPCTGGNVSLTAALESGLLGLAAVSTAITMAVCQPPPGLNRTAYLLSVSGLFFAGVAQVVLASVQAPGGHPHAAGRKLVYAAPVAVAAGLTVASVLLH